MSKLLPSQLTEEEILALLESDDIAEKSEVFNYADDIVPFLSFYKITPGTTPVSKKLLYKLYKTYSKQPLDERNFNVQVGVYIEANGYNYNLNLDNFAISNHIYTAEKKKDKTKSLTYQKHFNWFIQEKQVLNGRTWVEGFILYFIYKDFCRERRVNPKLGYTSFHKFLKLSFPYKRIKENRSLWFRVDETTANTFTEEEKNVIREARTKEKGRSKEEGESKTEESPSE